MRLLRADTEDLQLETFNDERKLPKYAILSHVWLPADEEVLFEDAIKGHTPKGKQGWAKLDYTRKQAMADGLQYVWIDTCCIDKSSSAELTEAINSMYRWYNLAQVCYAYLADMPEPQVSPRDDSSEELSYVWDWYTYGLCRWFTRGWTLQEMVAPSYLMFYNSSWKPIGTLVELSERVAHVTGVHEEALRRHWPVSSYSIAQRMSWATGRQVTKVEDRAYSLLGIFDVNLPIIYGEGEKAFARLQEEILKAYTDQTLFAWLALRPEQREQRQESSPALNEQVDILANSPDAFERCSQVVPLVPEDHESRPAYQVTDTGVLLTLRCIVEGLHFEGNRSWWRPPEEGDTIKVEAALNCCFQDDCMKILVLHLEESGVKDSYVVRGGAVVNRSSWCMPKNDYRNSYDKTRIDTSILRSFTILRRRNIQSIQQPVRSSADTIICRIRRPSESRFAFEVLFAEPAELWSHDDHSFSIRVDVCEPRVGDEFQARLAFRYGWSRKSTGLCLKIVASWRGGSWHCSSRIERLPFTSLIIFSCSACSDCAYDMTSLFGGVITRVGLHRLVDGEYIFIDVELCGLRWIVRQTTLFIFWLLLTFVLLPLAVIVPVATFSVARRLAYTREGLSAESSLTPEENIALSVGIPLTCVVSAALLLDSQLYVLWRPKSWRIPMLWLLRAASICICGWQLTLRSADHVMAWGRLVVFMLLNVALPVVTYRRLPFPCGTGAGLFCFSAGMNVLLLFFIMLFPLSGAAGWDAPNTLVPWTRYDCQHFEAPQLAAMHYSSESQCLEAADTAKSFWALVALGVYQFLLELLAIYQHFAFEPRSKEENETKKKNRLQRLEDAWLFAKVKDRDKIE